MNDDEAPPTPNPSRSEPLDIPRALSQTHDEDQRAPPAGRSADIGSPSSLFLSCLRINALRKQGLGLEFFGLACRGLSTAEPVRSKTIAPLWLGQPKAWMNFYGAKETLAHGNYRSAVSG